MPSLELLFVCLTAFVAVGVLLTFLAGLMRLIEAVFPAREITTDAALIAAVATAVQTVYPGTQVTKVEEIK